MIVPSSSFSATLPVKPSQTTTSAAPSSSSRLSALPANASSLAASSACASRVSWLPFSASSPIERSRTSRPLEPEDLLGEDRAHVGELEQVLGAVVRVRARIEQDGRASAGGDRHRDRRPQHAGDATQMEGRRRASRPCSRPRGRRRRGPRRPRRARRRDWSRASRAPPRPASRASRSPRSSRRARARRSRSRASRRGRPRPRSRPRRGRPRRSQPARGHRPWRRRRWPWPAHAELRRGIVRGGGARRSGRLAGTSRQGESAGAAGRPGRRQQQLRPRSGRLLARRASRASGRLQDLAQAQLAAAQRTPSGIFARSRIRFCGSASAQGDYGTGVRSGSISRPLYVLQVGQTRCGRFG